MPLHKVTFMLTVLSMFTTTEKAAEIEGDLLEQSRRHGKLWLIVQVKLTSILLFLHALRNDALKLLLGGYAVYELVLKLNWWLLNPLRRALGSILELTRAEMGFANDAINVAVALLLGFLVTRVAPKAGSQIILVATGLMLAREAVLDSLQSSLELAMVGLIPVFAGVLLAKWLELHQLVGQEAKGVGTR